MNEENKSLIMEQPKLKDVYKNIVFIAIAVGMAYFVTVKIGIDNIRYAVEQAGFFGPFIIILLKATTIVVVPLGGTPIYPIAGAIFGFWKALGITLIGDMIGASIAFYISRLFGRSILGFFMSKNQMPIVEKIIEKSTEPKTFWKARIFFAGFPELFAYASGLTKVSYFTFIFAYLSIHAIVATLLVLFGDLLVSGNVKIIILVGVISSLLALLGVFWFHTDLAKGN